LYIYIQYQKLENAGPQNIRLAGIIFFAVQDNTYIAAWVKKKLTWSCISRPVMFKVLHLTDRSCIFNIPSVCCVRYIRWKSLFKHIGRCAYLEIRRINWPGVYTRRSVVAVFGYRLAAVPRNARLSNTNNELVIECSSQRRCLMWLAGCKADGRTDGRDKFFIGNVRSAHKSAPMDTPTDGVQQRGERDISPLSIFPRTFLPFFSRSRVSSRATRRHRV